jgi:hypothetical protein
MVTLETLLDLVHKGLLQFRVEYRLPEGHAILTPLLSDDVLAAIREHDTTLWIFTRFNDVAICIDPVGHKEQHVRAHWPNGEEYMQCEACAKIRNSL